jgi:N-methylhydantoinase A
MWRVGIDVGGTFTDLFAWEEETGHSVTAKVLTTKQDRALGVLQAIQQAKLPFQQIATLIHGSTTATNALIDHDHDRRIPRHYRNWSAATRTVV